MMYDEANIWLINAHTKCHSGYHNLEKQQFLNIFLSLEESFSQLTFFPTQNIMHLNILHESLPL